MYLIEGYLNGMPAAVAVIQTFGDFLGFNPRMHMLASDGCFGCDGIFYTSSINIDTASLEELFRYRVFKMLLSRSLITTSTVELILSWRHLRFWVLLRREDLPKR
ncbi:MAG: transposase [Actinobacteria bacterium]|nr:transposase [Actinomycetota bacterium]MBL7124202.1 transposase [Actinomycetota bacterium]